VKNSITKRKQENASQNQQETLQMEQRKWRKTKEEDEDSKNLHQRSTTENGYKDRNKLSREGKSDTII